MAATLAALLLPALGCLGSLGFANPGAVHKSRGRGEARSPRENTSCTTRRNQYSPIGRRQVRRALHLTTTASIEQDAQALDSHIRWCNEKRIKIFAQHSQSG